MPCVSGDTEASWAHASMESRADAFVQTWQPAFPVTRLHAGAQARAKAKAAGQPFFDAAVLSGSARFPRALPELLQPRAGHLLPAQVRVYEDFARIPRTAAGFGAAHS